jgi:type IV pilus assembly protein PilC
MSEGSREGVDSAADSSADSVNPFPENELPKWLLRKSLAWGRQAVFAARTPPYKKLAGFSFGLATCAESSADMVRGLELCLKPMRGTAIGERWSGAVAAVRKGSSLADALSPAKELLPPFFLPVIQAGEQSGRLGEALRFLEKHCNLLAGPALALRNVWLFPVVILMFGSVMQFILHLMMGSVGEAFSVLLRELLSWLQLAVMVAIVIWTPVRYFFDQLRLAMPFIGPLEREIAVHRFFRVLALVYSVGGHRVEVMIRTAAETVSNKAARLELLKAAKAIEQQATIPDALRRVSVLTPDEQAAIETAEMSGTLEEAFDRISCETGESMIAKLRIVEMVLVRIVSALVIFSIVITAIGLALR